MTANKSSIDLIVGHYGLLNNGLVVGPLYEVGDDHKYFVDTTNQGMWYKNGTSATVIKSDTHIIAVISPQDIQAVASGELQKLREQVESLINYAELNKVRFDCAVTDMINLYEKYQGFSDEIRRNVNAMISRNKPY